ncbi:hypothetical protein AVEN_181641-1 [Araneus ventricosus]|uniref:RING-type domain-containing protein n=1 Tax=Araneus ventricosus TaxID=182803 RepID=A0A4Y2CLH3_ARAVE|nr:hypothetical protein AVEN_181641-1 [Araneus ventricosus]
MDFGKSENSVPTTSNDVAVASSSSTVQKSLTNEKVENACRSDVIARVRNNLHCMITEVKSIPTKKRVTSCGICETSDIFSSSAKKVWLSCGHVYHKKCFDSQFHLPQGWHCPSCGTGVEVMNMTKRIRGMHYT